MRLDDPSIRSLVRGEETTITITYTARLADAKREPDGSVLISAAKVTWSGEESTRDIHFKCTVLFGGAHRGTNG
jgi:hypothetical protein